MTEDDIVGWHYQLKGHKSEQTLGNGEGQGSLAYYSPWDCKVSNMTVTEQQHQKTLSPNSKGPLSQKFCHAVLVQQDGSQ